MSAWYEGFKMFIRDCIFNLNQQNEYISYSNNEIINIFVLGWDTLDVTNPVSKAQVTNEGLTCVKFSVFIT